MKEMWHGTLVHGLRKLGAGKTVIKHRRIKCFGAGESQMEAMLPGPDPPRPRPPRRDQRQPGHDHLPHHLLRPNGRSGPRSRRAGRGHDPKCLGDLVFGEEDDELQDAVFPPPARKGANARHGGMGYGRARGRLVGGAATARAAYLGGVVLTGPTIRAAMARRVRRTGRASRACGKGTGGGHGGGLPAAVRQRLRPCGRAVPRARSGADEPKPLWFGLAAEQGVTVHSVPFAAHPALARTLAGKQALNLVRLAML